MKDEILNELLLLSQEDKMTPKKAKRVHRCECCGKNQEQTDNGYIYLCPEHRKHFCKTCLTITDQINKHKSIFRARCLRPDCSFLRMDYGK